MLGFRGFSGATSVVGTEHAQHLGVNEHEQHIFEINPALLKDEQGFLRHRCHSKQGNDAQKQLFGEVDHALDVHAASVGCRSVAKPGGRTSNVPDYAFTRLP